MPPHAPALNRAYLRELYGDDPELVAIMFEAFLEETLPQWNNLADLLRARDFARLGALTHQIKPTFSMVGLTDLHAPLQELERLARYEPDPVRIEAIHTELDAQVRQVGPLVEAELQRLRQPT
jgi:HPt (histidine-containing phosphotransfer) domain-containing protein